MAEEKRISLHRALAELKLCDAKINKTALQQQALLIYREDGKGEEARKDFAKKAQSDYDSNIALIDRRQKIKTAIVKANAETMVTVGEKSMTISDAITLKFTIEAKKILIENLTKQHNQIKAELERANTQVEAAKQQVIIAAVGKDNVQTKAEDVKAIGEVYMKTNEFHLFDPIKITDKIEGLTNEYLDFCTNVDAALSEINATTFITV